VCMITTPCLCVVCAGVGVGVGAGVGLQACVHDYNSLLVCCVRRCWCGCGCGCGSASLCA